MLYVGARTKDHLAYASSIPGWEAAGIEVRPVFSEAGEGYVQVRAGGSQVAGLQSWVPARLIWCPHPHCCCHTPHPAALNLHVSFAAQFV